MIRKGDRTGTRVRGVGGDGVGGDRAGGDRVGVRGWDRRGSRRWILDHLGQGKTVEAYEESGCNWRVQWC